VRELNLISQDVTAYGRDRHGVTDLPRLLRALGKIGGRFWIRLLYGHPAHVTPEILEAMAAVRQVCRYLDLPIQHSHPEMLEAMGRPSPRQGLVRLFEEIRGRLPGAALRTTCMVGYPGETARHFQHLLDFTAEIAFDHLGVFRFSPEPGTVAATLPRRVGARCAAEREKRLMLQQRRLVTGRNRGRLGQSDTIMLERTRPRRPTVWVGRSPACAPEVDGVTYVSMTRPARRLRPGSFVRAHYTRTRGYDMEACA
ncbi:MAG: radical SAM protein, partial [Lentisphaerae bacterium]|nr:radical SAM protein [Lentisphaerota bacterium]